MLEDRILPQAVEVEQAVLGACLIDKVAIEKASAILGKQDLR